MNLDKKIKKIMSGSYIPSLADSTRIYREYKDNKEELAGCLGDVYNWLAQEPVCTDFKHGNLYLRCEITSTELFVVHYLYVNSDARLHLDGYFGMEYDIVDYSLKELMPHLKRIISDEIKQIKDEKSCFEI